MENVSLHKSRAPCKDELNHTKKISQANYLSRKHYFAWSQRRKKAFIKRMRVLIMCYVSKRKKQWKKVRQLKLKQTLFWKSVVVSNMDSLAAYSFLSLQTSISPKGRQVIQASSTGTCKWVPWTYGQKSLRGSREGLWETTSKAKQWGVT